MYYLGKYFRYYAATYYIVLYDIKIKNINNGESPGNKTASTFPSLFTEYFVEYFK